MRLELETVKRGVTYPGIAGLFSFLLYSIGGASVIQVPRGAATYRLTKASYRLAKTLHRIA